MPHHELDWEDTLTRAGLRVTRQRQVVLDAVCAGDGHTPIGEIFARAKRQDPEIQLSTIYRTLRTFADLGIVLTVPSTDGELLYEVRHASPHHHLICKQCGGQTQLAAEIAAAMVVEVEQTHGFAVALDHLVLWGICASCRASREATD